MSAAETRTHSPWAWNVVPKHLAWLWQDNINLPWTLVWVRHNPSSVLHMYIQYRASQIHHWTDLQWEISVSSLSHLFLVKISGASSKWMDLNVIGQSVHQNLPDPNISHSEAWEGSVGGGMDGYLRSIEHILTRVHSQALPQVSCFQY